MEKKQQGYITLYLTLTLGIMITLVKEYMLEMNISLLIIFSTTG